MKSLRDVVSMVLGVIALIAATAATAGTAEVATKIKASPVGRVIGGWTVKETLVQGVYSLQHPSGQYEPYFTDEAVTMLKTNQGWQRLESGGLQPPMSDAEKQKVQAALFQWLKLDAAMPFRYGTGARKVVLISAFDCPSCRALERDMESRAKSLNATIYLFPMALNYRDKRAMDAATALWCRPDAASAWRSVMKGSASPTQGTTGNCGLRSAEYTRSLAAMLGSYGVPAFLFEDGRVVRGASALASELPALGVVSSAH